MFIVDLQCNKGHAFEGWYDTQKDYFDKLNGSEVECPFCNSTDIQRAPSKVGFLSNLNQISTEPTSAKHITTTVQSKIPIEAQKAIARILQRVRKSHEDVGPEFAKLAIAMAKGAEPERPIMGQSTLEEERFLDDEGVPFFKIPVPDIENN